MYIYIYIVNVIYTLINIVPEDMQQAVKTLVQECCEKSVLFFFLLISFICTSIRISFDFLIYIYNVYIYVIAFYSHFRQVQLALWAGGL